GPGICGAAHGFPPQSTDRLFAISNFAKPSTILGHLPATPRRPSASKTMHNLRTIWASESVVRPQYGAHGESGRHDRLVGRTVLFTPHYRRHQRHTGSEVRRSRHRVGGRRGRARDRALSAAVV